MELILDRCIVRSWRRTDAQRLARIANDRAIWINTSDRFPHPYTLMDAESFITGALAEGLEHSFAITVDDQVVGGIGVQKGDGIRRIRGEIGYWLGAEWWGQGIGTDALRGVSDWAFTHFDLVRLDAYVFTWNPASARVLEKAGFTREATARSAAIKDGQLCDEWVYVRFANALDPKQEKGDA